MRSDQPQDWGSLFRQLTFGTGPKADRNSSEKEEKGIQGRIAGSFTGKLAGYRELGRFAPQNLLESQRFDTKM